MMAIPDKGKFLSGIKTIIQNLIENAKPGELLLEASMFTNPVQPDTYHIFGDNGKVIELLNMGNGKARVFVGQMTLNPTNGYTHIELEYKTELNDVNSLLELAGKKVVELTKQNPTEQRNPTWLQQLIEQKHNITRK